MEATIKPRPIHVPPIELGSIDLPPPLPLRKSSDKRIRAPFLASNTPTLPSPKRGCLNQKVVPTSGCGRGRRTSLFKTQQNNGGTAVGLGQDPPPPAPGQHDDPEANSPSDPDKIITPAPVPAITDPKVCHKNDLIYNFALMLYDVNNVKRFLKLLRLLIITVNSELRKNQ